MITVAFYKGRDHWLDRAIQAATGGPYSHVELIAGVAGGGDTVRCLSSSWRDGGVRAKVITLHPDRWDFVTIDTPANPAVAFIEKQIGRRYDILGALACPFLPSRLWGPRRWFCSELVAASLGLRRAHRYDPTDLYRVLTLR